MFRMILALVIFVAFSGAARAGAVDDAEQCALGIDGSKSDIDDPAIKIDDPNINFDDTAIEFCTKAIDSGDLSVEDLASTHFARGHKYLFKRDADRAIFDFSRALQLKPFLIKPLLARLIAYQMKGEKQLAFADVSRVIRLDPNNVEGLVSRGFLFLLDGDYDRAIPDLDQAIGLDPNTPFAFLNRGAAYLAKGDFDRAIADFDIAIQLKPEFPEAFWNLGSVYGKMRRYDRAIANYDKAIELKPDYTEAYIGKATTLNNQAWYLATAGNADERDGREAVRLALGAVGLIDSHGIGGTLAAGFADTLATAYAAAGRFDDAVETQERAIEMLRAAGQRNAVADARIRLDLYRLGLPYRE